MTRMWKHINCLRFLKLKVEPGHTERKRIVKAGLVARLDDLVGVLGIHHLDEHLAGHLCVALTRITHNIKTKHTGVIVEITVNDGIVFTHQGLALIHQILAVYLFLRISHSPITS